MNRLKVIICILLMGAGLVGCSSSKEKEKPTTNNNNNQYHNYYYIKNIFLIYIYKSLKIIQIFSPHIITINYILDYLQHFLIHLLD